MLPLIPPLPRLLAVCLLLPGLPALAADPLPLSASQLKALAIKTQAVGQTGEGRSGSLPGRVVIPNDQLRIVAAPVGGMIDHLAVAPGMAVRRGQVVARLASPQALELQRDALQAGSQAALLQQSLKRDETLFSEGLIPESRLQATRAAATQATAQASERQQGLALAGVTPGKLGGPLALTAPIDGVVLDQTAQLGQRVESAAPIYRIARLSPLWLEMQVPLALAETLQPGSEVRIPESGVRGKLIAVGRAVDAASQTVLLRAAVHQGAERLSPGQVVEIDLPGGAGALHNLPAGALVRERGQVIAFVERPRSDTTGNAASQFEARPVRIVRQGGDNVVVEGLKTGEQVVVQGVSGLKAQLAGIGKE